MGVFTAVNTAVKSGEVRPRSFSIFILAISLCLVMCAAFGGAWVALINFVFVADLLSTRYQREHLDKDVVTTWGEAVAYNWVLWAMVVVTLISWFVDKWASSVVALAMVPIVWQGYYVALARHGKSVQR